MKSTKHEARNPKQIQNSNGKNSKRFGLGILNLDIVSDFDIRISNFLKHLFRISDFGFRAYKRGFTILFAVLVGSLLFSIGLAIAHLTLKEIVLSAAGKQSETAFFAADTGVECALYWDLRIGSTFPRFDTDTAKASIQCNSAAVPLTLFSSDTTAATTTFRLNFASSCTDVTVGKTKQQGQIPSRVIIEARGRNDADCGNQSLNPARVERALRVRY